MTQGLFKKTCHILATALLLLFSLYSPIRAETDGDLQTLEMFYEGKDLVVSATRNPKPLSQTAENVAVVTAADIEMMGAHTLPDVLNNIPGLQTDDRGSIATFGGLFIQGADPFNILFLLDGVTLNFIGAGLADIAPIPVQNIERIEIVKGPASSSWGSALGGVVNIVTKSPLEGKKLGGALSFSAGERGTRDSRGEVSGTVGPLGYYLHAGNIVSDGLSPNTPLDLNNVYGKLRRDLPGRGSLLFTLAYTTQSAGEGQAEAFQISLRDRKKNLLSTLSLNHPLGDKAALDLSLRTSWKRFDSLANDLITGEPLPDIITHEWTLGGSAKLALREGIQSIAAGADFDHVDYDDATVQLKGEKWGLFLNDTFSLGAFAITPGVRYDRLNQVGGFISPSLGATWRVNDRTILRAYGARGHSLPVMFPGATREKVLTVQTGVETTQLPFLWLKATLFLNYISDHQSFDEDWNLILVKHKRQGVEVEARTVPLFNTSLAAGYTFVDVRSRESGEVVRNIPRQVVKLGVHYDDRSSFRGTLLGRYVWWNASADNNARYTAIIWDLNLSKRVFALRDTAVELFFSAHNLFNGAQYNFDAFQNARRWLEGGIKFSF